MKRITTLSVAVVLGLFVAMGNLLPVALADTSMPGCFVSPTLDPNQSNFMAGDISDFTTNQQTVNCFAWQNFIAVNWPVNPTWPDQPEAAGEPDRSADASQFGMPRDHNADVDPKPVVWETFKRAQDIFNSNSPTTPTAWGLLPEQPDACSGADADDKILSRRAKASVSLHDAKALSDVENPDRFMQATGNWLSDQNHELVWYELLTNRAEFESILENKWYLTSGQRASLTSSTGLRLPKGVKPPAGTIQTWKDLGAMELKAAWRILTDKPELWSRYYTVSGWTYAPDAKACSQEVFGLVGLHIIQKTERFNNLMWSTFEHIDNVPEDGRPVPADGYSFYDANCKGDACIPETQKACAEVIQKSGEGQLTPPPKRPDPIQVKRCYPVGNADQLATLNSEMQKMIADASGGKSVFQYYQLVNVLWPETSLPEPAAGATVPLNVSTMTQAGGQPVSNVTMETFLQNADCTTCHAYASSKIPNAKGSYATDFSFLFDEAFDDLKKDN